MMKVICFRCKTVLEVAGGLPGISHGICEDCGAAWLAENLPNMAAAAHDGLNAARLFRRGRGIGAATSAALL